MGMYGLEIWVECVYNGDIMEFDQFKFCCLKSNKTSIDYYFLLKWNFKETEEDVSCPIYLLEAWTIGISGV